MPAALVCVGRYGLAVASEVGQALAQQRGFSQNRLRQCQEFGIAVVAPVGDPRLQPVERGAEVIEELVGAGLALAGSEHRVGRIQPGVAIRRIECEMGLHPGCHQRDAPVQR
jgi:hypothetical protein